MVWHLIVPSPKLTSSLNIYSNSNPKARGVNNSNKLLRYNSNRNKSNSKRKSRRLPIPPWLKSPSSSKLLWIWENKKVKYQNNKQPKSLRRLNRREYLSLAIMRRSILLIATEITNPVRRLKIWRKRSISRIFQCRLHSLGKYQWSNNNNKIKMTTKTAGGKQIMPKHRGSADKWGPLLVHNSMKARITNLGETLVDSWDIVVMQTRQQLCP